VQHGRAAKNIAEVCRGVIARRPIAAIAATDASGATEASAPSPTLKGAA